MTDNNESTRDNPQELACSIGSVPFGQGRLAVIAGPCMAESLELCIEVASRMAEICKGLDIGYVSDDSLATTGVYLDLFKFTSNFYVLFK